MHRVVTSIMVLALLSWRTEGVRSPLLQVWGVNLAGTRDLTPAEVWGVGLERTQNVAFDPEEAFRNRESYQNKFGLRGETLIALLGNGKHVDDVARDLDKPSLNLLQRRRSLQYSSYRK